MSNPETNPSSRDFGHSVCGDALDILVWRNNLPKFFEDITGLPPYPYQLDFMKEMEQIYPAKFLISAGRQLGKSKVLSVLALWYAYVLPMSPDVGHPITVLILAGSFAQAKLTYEYIVEYIFKIPWLKGQLKTLPTFSPMGAEIEFIDGSNIRALTASPKQVRGPHADLLIVDEAAEADEDLLQASFQTTIASAIGRSILASTPHQAKASSYLFIDYYTHPAKYGFDKVYEWSAKDCPNPNIQRNYQQALQFMDEGLRSIEFEGKPYSFAGRVFPLKQLRECSQFKGLIEIPEGGPKYAGVDWGFSPAPTCLTIVQKLEGERFRVLFTDAYLGQNFADVIDQIEKICKSYKVLTIHADSSHIGENQRLSARGLNVYPVKFKTEKAWMISNLRAIVEGLRIEIDDERDDRLKQQMLAYSYNSKRDDDFVDSLMLSCKATSLVISHEKSFEQILEALNPTPGERNVLSNPMKKAYNPRYTKDPELITPEERRKWEKQKEIKRAVEKHQNQGCPDCGSHEVENNGIESIICKQCKRIVIGDINK